jgi:putative transposase
VQLVKGGFSYRARRELGFASEVWQRGFADRYIRSAREFEVCAEYVRGNPSASQADGS